MIINSVGVVFELTAGGGQRRYALRRVIGIQKQNLSFETVPPPQCHLPDSVLDVRHLSHKGGSLCVKDVFAKKIFGAGGDFGSAGDEHAALIIGRSPPSAM